MLVAIGCLGGSFAEAASCRRQSLRDPSVVKAEPLMQSWSWLSSYERHLGKPGSSGIQTDHESSPYSCFCRAMPNPRVLDRNDEPCWARLKGRTMLFRFGTVVWTRERGRLAGMVVFE